jgi:hypothetical protein
MATLLNEGFNGQTNGTAASSSTIPNAGTISGTGVITHSTSNTLEGDNVLSWAAQANFRIIEYTLISRSNTFMSIYVYLNAAPAANSYFGYVRDGGNTVDAAQVGFTTAGELRIRDGTTQVDITTGFAAATWHRVDWELLGSANQTLWIYKGATLHSTSTSDAWATLTGALTATTFGRIGVGSTIAVVGGWSASIDSLRADDATMPAPPIAMTVASAIRVSAVWRRTLGLK